MAEVEVMDMVPIPEAAMEGDVSAAVGKGKTDDAVDVPKLCNHVYEKGVELEVMKVGESQMENGQDKQKGTLDVGKSDFIVSQEDKSLGEKAALGEVGNKLGLGTPISQPKKSNLKRPKCETPEQNGGVLTPSKRIRIVENLDAVNKNNYMQLEGDTEAGDTKGLSGADETACVKEVEIDGEKVLWLMSPSSYVDQSIVNVDFVRDHLSPAKRNFSVEIDMRFILTEVVTAILSCKSKIASVSPSDFHVWIARNSAFNNYPELKCMYKENFLKAANIDALLKYDLTLPKELTVNSSVDRENIYFVGDLWHSSKGFREYILWKTSRSQNLFSTKILTMKIDTPHSKGDLATNKSGILFYNNERSVADNEDFYHLSPEMVESCEGCVESQNILDVKTIKNYINFVQSRSNGTGLHVLFVDNPEFSNVYESCRESRYQKHFYCECLVALSSLRKGGTFICKIFDSFTLFTTGLLFLLYKCFKNITIHKPSSSPAYTSERFLICQGKIDNIDSKYVVDFLSDCLDMVVNNQEQRKIVRRRIKKRLTVLRMEVQTIVPLKLILSHAEFFEFVRHSNIRLSTQLIESIDTLCESMGRTDQRKSNMIDSSLKTKHFVWNVPPELLVDIRKDCWNSEERSLKFLTDNNLMNDISPDKQSSLEGLRMLVTMYLTATPTESVMVFPVLSSSSSRAFKTISGFFFGCGAFKIMHLCEDSWRPVETSDFALPFGTIVFGEIAEEIYVEGNKQKFVSRFYLFDVVFVFGLYVGSTSYTNRQSILSRLTTCLGSNCGGVKGNIRTIQSLRLDEISTFYNRIIKGQVILGYKKNVGRYLRYENKSEKRKTFALVSGFLLVKTDQPDQSPKNFFKNYQRYVWHWDECDDGYKTPSQVENKENPPNNYNEALPIVHDKTPLNDNDESSPIDLYEAPSHVENNETPPTDHNETSLNKHN